MEGRFSVTLSLPSPFAFIKKIMAHHAHWLCNLWELECAVCRCSHSSHVLCQAEADKARHDGIFRESCPRAWVPCGMEPGVTSSAL